MSKSEKFFIGTNKFYDGLEEAQAELAMFEAEYNIPQGIFAIIGLEEIGMEDEEFPEPQGPVN